MYRFDLSPGSKKGEVTEAWTRPPCCSLLKVGFGSVPQLDRFLYHPMILNATCQQTHLQGSARRLGRRSWLDGRSGSWCGDRDSGNWDSDGCGSLKLSSGRLGRRSRGRLDGRSGGWCGDRDNGDWDGNGGSSLKKSVIGLGGDGEEGSNKDREGLHCIYILDVIEIWCK